MPAKWQTWMPHVIDAWRGSDNVSALSDGAYRAYHYLLMAEWQSEDGMLPCDDEFLSRASRMHKRWPKVRDEVLRMFKRDGERIFSPKCLEEWKRAFKVYCRQGGRNKEVTGQTDLDFDRLPSGYPPIQHDTATATPTSTKATTAPRREYAKKPNARLGMNPPITSEEEKERGRREQLLFWRQARDANKPIWGTVDLAIVRALDAEDAAMAK